MRHKCPSTASLDQGADNEDWIARAPQAHPKTEPSIKDKLVDEQLCLWKPALALLVGAALEHFFLVPGDLGIDHMYRYPLFLESWSAVGVVLRLRLGMLRFASLTARTSRPRGIGHGYSYSLPLYRYRSSCIRSYIPGNASRILGSPGLL
jgi:hypothetical protein